MSIKPLIPVIIITLILAGCVGGTVNCGNDLDCLKNAFKDCKKANGILLEENGKIGIEILGDAQGKCEVSFRVEDTGTEMDLKMMACLIPKYKENQPYSVKDDCTGDLKDFTGIEAFLGAFEKYE